MALLAAAVIAVPIYPLNLVVIPAIALGVALLLNPVLAPIMLILSVPAQDVGALVVGGASVTGTRLALAAAIAALALQLPTRGERMRGTWLLAPFGLYLSAILLSLLGARQLAPGIDVFYQWSVTVVALILVLYAVRTRRGVLLLVAVMGAGAAAEASLGLVQGLANLGPASYAITSRVSRAFGTFGMPNSYAGYLEMTTPLLAVTALWSLAQTRAAWLRYRGERVSGMAASRTARRHLLRGTLLSAWLTFAALLGFAGIVMSFSRGAWLGIAAGGLAMLLVSGRRASLLAAAAVIFAGLIFAAGGVHYAPAAIQDRYQQLTGQLTYFNSNDVLLTDENFAAVERMAHWQTGIAMFLAHPLSGVGAGNFNGRFADFAVNPAFTVSRGHAHNYYIQAAAETGAIGLISYLLLITGALLVCFRSAREAPTGLGRALGVGAVGVTVAVMVHNVVEDLHVLNLGIQLSAVWALAIIGWRFLPAEEDHAQRVEAIST
ncbi:MAG TPA: O-antigen ligase family protein [Thermomicrobiaceae bacterium]|nr:O-antigen ligase family protein [Thermomicrobiaceae bacterium]